MSVERERKSQRLGIRTASALAIAGWALVIGLLVYGPDWLRAPGLDVPILWLGLLAVIARLLAFDVHTSSRIAIDSAFYIAAVFISGGASATLLVLVVLTTDASVPVSYTHLTLPTTPYV